MEDTKNVEIVATKQLKEEEQASPVKAVWEKGISWVYRGYIVGMTWV
jgi:hypothetical protein